MQAHRLCDASTLYMTADASDAVAVQMLLKRIGFSADRGRQAVDVIRVDRPFHGN